MYKNNPFAVQTPEDISAEDAYNLFINVFTDFYQVPKVGHAFLHGPRGSGKSMMFRYMMPDCQLLKTKKQLNELEYFSIYIPIKKTTLNLTNLERLDNHAQYLINEHLLVSYIALTLFEELEKLLPSRDDKGINQEFLDFYNEVFVESIRSSGSINIKANTDAIPYLQVIKQCRQVCKQVYLDINNYIKSLFLDELKGYNGPLYGYLDFLYPLLIGLKKISLFPSSNPFFLLIDDADNLNKPQTKVLNTWVSFRTSAQVSLKISTQLKYKTYRTVSGQSIDTPHDYSEINIATIYTSSKNKYYERIKTIVEKRLELYLGKKIDANTFFGPDEKQEREIEQVAQRIKERYQVSGKGATEADDVKRYATPDYIKELKGKRSGSTYSYAGFKQLVSISSGVIRYFLEPASIMFSEMTSIDPENEFESILPSIQDIVIKNYSDDYILKDFEKYFIEEKEGEVKTLLDKQLRKSDKLRNLIVGLGGMFHSILLSDASERRVFSIALSSKPDGELEEILNMGVEYGYFHESTIGNKQGTGRTKLYILNRLLAPHFKLDATSFAGYKFLKAETLHEALNSPQSFISKMKDSLPGGKNQDDESEIFQLSLFE